MVTIRKRMIAAGGAIFLLVLLISGEAKRQLLRRVCADRAFDPPVAAILRQSRTPVRVLWAP